MKKNIKSQLEYVRDYFKSKPNEEIQTTKAKAYIEKRYLTETGKRFEDPDRAIRTLHQKGEIVKIRQGLYKYDPSFSGQDKKDSRGIIEDQFTDPKVKFGDDDEDNNQ